MDKIAMDYEQPKQAHGCFVGRKLAIVILVLAIIMALGVGIIVYVASGSKSCNFDDGEEFWNKCESMAVTDDRCIALPDRCSQSESTSSGTTPNKPLEDIFLPSCLTPYHYNLLMWPWIYAYPNETEADPDSFHNYGEVEIFLECHHANDVITLHARNLDIASDDIALITVEPSNAAAPTVQSVSEDKAREFYKVHLSEKLTPGHKYRLSMNWIADIDASLLGFYRSSYDIGGRTHWLAATQFQATEARSAFPCMDEPDLKATFNVSLKRLESFTTLANMHLLESSEPIARDSGVYVTDIYTQSVRMPTYLVAFMFSEFESVEDSTDSGTTVKIWARPNAISQADYSLQLAVFILQHFEDYFNIPYPLPKLDMVAMPDFSSGAMENWGLINFRETKLLFEDGVSTMHSKENIAILLSHELAHQWFGNLVTLKWWDDLWLNEGFATFVQYLGVDEAEVTWDVKEVFLNRDLHPVFETDALTTSHPIYVPVTSNSQIIEIFDQISYSKGAALLRMMQNFLGEDTFNMGLTNYLNDHEYGNANHSDLWDALNQQAEIDDLDLNVRDVMDTWILQMGYPVVTISRDDNDPTVVHVTQEYFQLNDSSEVSTKYPSSFGYKWTIPLTIISSESRLADDPAITWMERQDVSIHMSDVSTNAWLLGNVDQMGYYRVNYDAENWDKLIQQLSDEHESIPTINRAQILDDSFQLSRAGILDPLIFMRSTEYIDNETELTVWKAFQKSMNSIDAMIRYTSLYGNFCKYIEEKMLIQYDYLRWRDISVHKQSALQTLIVSTMCSVGHSPCIQTAKEKFQQWMINPARVDIAPDLEPTMYCTGISQGGVEEWEFVLQKYRESNIGTEKRVFLKALSCASEPWILARYIELLRNDTDFRKQDILAGLTYISENIIGRDMVWDHVRTHWDYIQENWAGEPFELQHMLSGITVTFNSEIALEELHHFEDSHPDLGSVERTFSQVMEKTYANFHWTRNNKNAIRDWLAEQLN